LNSFSTLSGSELPGISKKYTPLSQLNRTKKILIIGEDTRSFLACIRSFGRAGFEVHVCYLDSKTSALKSRYVKEVHALPSYVGDGTFWRNRIFSLIAAYKLDAIFPCDERALLPLVEVSSSIPPEVWLGIPNREAFEVFFDKEKTRHVATLCGIPIAEGTALKVNGDISFAGDFTFPIVVKPLESFSIQTLHSRNSVQFAYSDIELSAVASKFVGKRIIIEEVFEGDGVGVSVLSCEGNVAAAFQHLRVNSAPNGNSAYRKSEAINPTLLKAVQSLCKATGFSGIGMFEFKVQSADQWILLEVNARPWGSIPLPVALGINFPWWWYAISNDIGVAVTSTYEVGRYGRNLFADYYQFKQSLVNKTGTLNKFTAATEWLSSFKNLLLGREHLDTFSFDDPRPALSEISVFIRTKLLGAKIPTRHYLEQVISGSIKAAQIGGRSFCIEFVCFGNICRSPYAAKYLESIQNEFELPVSLSVSSSGTYQVIDRPSPNAALDCAQARGIHLGNHRSRYSDIDLLEKADLILVFDQKVTDILHARFSRSQERVLNLGHLIRRNEITDPYGLEDSAFQTCYSQIEAAVTVLLRVISQKID
jgi:protein-tyrosine-phosphatase